MLKLTLQFLGSISRPLDYLLSVAVGQEITSALLVFVFLLKGYRIFAVSLFLLQKSNEVAYIWDPLAMLMKLKL